MGLKARNQGIRNGGVSGARRSGDVPRIRLGSLAKENLCASPWFTLKVFTIDICILIPS